MAHGGGSLRKMDTCPTSFLREKDRMLKSFSQITHVTKEKRNQMWKGRGLQVQKVGMVGMRERWWTWS